MGLSYIFSQGRVIGTDISEPQVAAANAKPNLPSNVSFEVSAGEVLPAEDGEVDLVTVAQALHWFDLPRFYPECARALRSGGILAMFGTLRQYSTIAQHSCAPLMLASPPPTHPPRLRVANV